MPKPTNEEKSQLEQAKAAIEKVQRKIDEYRLNSKAAQTSADAAADAARIERLQQRVQHRLWGNPEEEFSKREALMTIAEEAAASPGGRAYENLKSSYQEIVRLAIALCYALSAYFRTSDRLVGGVSYLAKLVSSVVGSGTMPVELHQDLIKASQCDDAGHVTFDESLPSSLFTEATPASMRKDLSSMNEFLVRAFLLKQGYEPDDNDVYRHKDTGALLTPERFERLKNDREDGLRAFAEKHFPIRMTPRPMGPRGLSAPEPEPLESPDPAPSPPRPR